MRKPTLHPWTLDPDEAIRRQESLRDRLVLTWDERPIIDLAHAAAFVLACCRGYRMPEPLHRAHRMAFTLEQQDI